MPEEMPEELPADVVHHALAHILGGVGVAEVAKESQDQRPHVSDGDAIQPGQIPHRDVAIDGDLDEVRPQKLGAGVARQTHEGKANQAPVAPEIPEQTQDLSGVIGLAQDLVVDMDVVPVHQPFSFSARASNSRTRSCF